MNEGYRLNLFQFSGRQNLRIGFHNSRFNQLPLEILIDIVILMDFDAVFWFLIGYYFSSEVVFKLAEEKVKWCLKHWSWQEKRNPESLNGLKELIYLMFYMIDTRAVSVPFDDFSDLDGTCYLGALLETSWISVCRLIFGTYPSPWEVDVLYSAHSDMLRIRSCRDPWLPMKFKHKPESVCHGCLLEPHMVGRLNDIWPDQRELRHRLIFRKDTDDGLYHFCDAASMRYLSQSKLKKLQETYGDFTFLTMMQLREKDHYLTGRVGTPEVVDFDLVSELSRLTKEANSQRRENESTICPNDSASQITPKPLNDLKPKIQGIDNLSSLQEVISGIVASQIHSARSEVKISEKQRMASVLDYSKTEYESDLEEAFKSCGVVVRNGEVFLKPPAHTSACELIPKMTVDDRLNFLIRLHTAMFKIVDNTPDYPKPGMIEILRATTEGEMPDDHPSFDLLQIVLADTFDWSHMMIKSNNFLLPVLEPGMRINERIVCSCLLGLKGEYFTRWTSVMKDCVLPSDISDTTRWSDSHSISLSRRITQKRPDLAIEDRRHHEKRYSRKRRDSVLSGEHPLLRRKRV
jgi:hypothetical protein